MNDIKVEDDIYEFVAEFDTDKLNDWEDRETFHTALDGEDLAKDVFFYESYKNVLRYRNEIYLLVCEDYRYGFGIKHSLKQLLLHTDVVSIYKIKKDNK